MEHKVRKIGNSIGITFNKELRDKLKVSEKDVVYTIDTPEGVIMTPYDPEFAKQMDVARKVMSKHRDALHELAK